MKGMNHICRISKSGSENRPLIPWREANPDLKGNIRNYATINELICLSNMENINAVLINDGVPQGERLVKLNQIAIQQMRVLEESNNKGLLKQ